ncbi:MAG: ATP-binding protein [Anaerolineaceae bacterium]|nr:ATP-binding protein [Anaerolineaceae bacterium]
MLAFRATNVSVAAKNERKVANKPHVYYYNVYVVYLEERMFVDRQKELAFLNSLLEREHPGPAQFALMYGRRRVGKTSLLYHWAKQSGLLFTYWTAEKETPALQRRKLYATVLNLPEKQSPVFESWGETWNAIINWLGEKRHILVLDELPYAAESDPAMLSALQLAWDHSLKSSNIVLMLCGSHVHTMESLMFQQSPLFGRFTGQWHLQPLSFDALKEFFPKWTIEERIAAYAMVGGVPAYLEWLDPGRTLVENIRDVVLAPGNMFTAEPQFLLYDEVRDPQVYLAILKSIGLGAHSLNEISKTSLVNKAHLSSYLSRLQELHIVERRLPATVPMKQLKSSRKGRYHLSDSYFRFFFRFLAPYHDTLVFDRKQVLRLVKEGLRAFVGMTAFEELSREWVRLANQRGNLPFDPEVIGSHWGASVQVDVVAVNWHTRDILLGECKWGESGANLQIVRELIEHKSPKVLKDLPGEEHDWHIHYCVFTRRGITDAAQKRLMQEGGIVVNLENFNRDFSENSGNL